MLSFDITDRSIKIIRGNPAGGKIKILGSYILDVPEGMIINGKVEDLQGLSKLITDTLKINDMVDKEGIVSFSSSSIIFKELIVPKAKGDQLIAIVQNEMQASIGVDGNYSISFTIVGDAGEEHPNSLKVLATACPFEVADSYRKLFTRMPVTLRAVNISCNCITRVVLLDKRAEEKMPMLVCQIDKNFLSMNLYEHGQLSFSRFVNLAPEDYASEDDTDYIIEALQDNIFRMNQFCKVRGGEDIKNVVFYGDVFDFIKLTDSLESMDVKTSILPVPAQITGFENFEFTVFANAIGAMFKRKENERINLLEIDAKTGRSSGALNGFFISAGLAAIACIAVVAGAVFLLDMQVTSQEEKTADVETEIATYNAQIAQNNKLKKILAKIETYNAAATNATSAWLTYPSIKQEVWDTILDCAEAERPNDQICTIKDFDYTAGKISLSLETDDQDEPRQFIQNLKDTDYFADVTYNGYTGFSNVTYSITLTMKAGEAE